MFTQNINGCTKSDLKSTLAINHEELLEFRTERPTIPVAVAELVELVTEQAYQENVDVDVAIDLGLELNFDFAAEQVEVLS